MRYGHIITSITKVLLFGIAGSGKTSVTAIMTGDDPPLVHNSTSLMARPIQVITISIGQLMEWQKKTPEEVLRIIAEIIRSRKSHEINLEYTSSESKEVDSESDSRNYQSKSSHSEQVQPMKDQPPSKSWSKFDSILEEAAKKDDFLELVHSSHPPPEPILEQRWLYIIDSGGQPEFHNMLSVFVQKTNVCIFVFRIYEELDDYPPVAFYKNGRSVGLSYPSRLTNKQLFQKFIRTMRSFTSQKLKTPQQLYS